MARCGNKACRKKYDSSGQMNSFENWCSDECRVLIIKAKFDQASKQNPGKVSKAMAKKPHSHLVTKKKLQSKVPLKTYSSLKSTKGFKPVSAAMGSKEYRDRQQKKKAKAAIKVPHIQPLKLGGLSRDSAERKAQKICHLYIRTRDAGKPCICCGRPLLDDFQAGHYMESGNNSCIRYHEDNIHGQRADCNMTYNGDSGEYELRLRQKVGDKTVEWLHQMAGSKQVVKRTTQDFIDIINYYESKLKELRESTLVA